MLSTRNNNEIVQANLREMVSKSKTLADQGEEDEEEDLGDVEAGESTDYAVQESEDEDVLSLGSPTLPKTYSISSCKSKLNLNAPAFIPRNSPCGATSQNSVTPTSIVQQQQLNLNNSVVTTTDDRNAATTSKVGQQQQIASTPGAAVTPSNAGQQ
uniref:Uncharacterized protein n=1 Tax=Nicotiana tabacum TaxID=4097 RepID=A0A1S4ATS5_TOBAC|nr:PREDICTED: uncharacterized protein LOC107801350 [Nicotiana tabacum]